jgi:hypothetical protein
MIRDVANACEAVANGAKPRKTGARQLPTQHAQNPYEGGDAWIDCPPWGLDLHQPARIDRPPLQTGRRSENERGRSSNERAAVFWSAFENITQVNKKEARSNDD